jgi:hypothetical protein
MSELDDAIAAQEAARASLLSQLAPRHAEEARALARLTAEIEAHQARMLALQASIEKGQGAALAEIDERTRLQAGLSRLSKGWVRFVAPALASAAVLSLTLGVGLSRERPTAWLTAGAAALVGLTIGQLVRRVR